MAAGPPSPYYRVSAKAMIFDDDRLLVCQDKNGKWEIPGGGWEHGETMVECLSRELQEEVGAEVLSTGDVQFVWRDYSSEWGAHYLRLAVPVTLKSHDLVPKGEDDVVELMAARFVAKDEFLTLPFQEGEEGVKHCVDIIWPTEK